MVQKAKPEYLKIFSCTEGCRKKFDSISNLNNHLSKKHELNYKVIQDQYGHALKLRTF